MARYSKYGLALLTLFSFSAFAGPMALDCQTSTTLNESANDLLKIANQMETNCKPSMPNPKVFCGKVGIQGPSKDPNGLYQYEYQKIMYESACADMNSMDDNELNKKLQDWWKLYGDKLLCDSTQFNVTNGSVFKVAVYGNFTSFIDEAIQAKFDLNFVDEADGRTVLDYTRDELAKQTSTSPTRKVLQQYYDKLKAAGAKHKSEL